MHWFRKPLCKMLPGALAAVSSLCLLSHALGVSAPVKLSPGSSAPQFSRLDLAGNRVDLHALRGKVVLVDFWASWCAPCILEIPHLIDLQKRYAPQGLQVIGISMDDSSAPVATVTRRFAFNYPVLLGDAKFGNLYGGILGLPVQFLVGRDGKILHIWTGEVAPALLDKELQSAMR
jgi:cytochrome c biogenesis protein CcmG, thiol:disulfide interchange protein DsbE